MFLSKDKDVYVVGWNCDGQLGLDGSVDKLFEPKKLKLKDV